MPQIFPGLMWTDPRRLWNSLSGSSINISTSYAYPRRDLRYEPGAVRCKDKEMGRAAIDALLSRAFIGHFATASANGDPYVVPNLFVYETGRIQLHTAATGHFRRNVEYRARVSFEVAEPGEVFPYGEFECDTSASFESAVGFGAIRIETDDEAKARFFDRLLAKYVKPSGPPVRRASTRASAT
jgi:nitroimidazol reductase NimA-like FMN-containing flavoprotein (pyridoxamine 5'-phosphate oxidase superfamily)